MCFEACLICEQCEKFKNGCQGQLGTFFLELCPSYMENIDKMGEKTVGTA